MKLVIHLHLVLKLRMCGYLARSPTVNDFMEWCQGNCTLSIVLISLTVNFYLDFHKIGGFCIFRPSLDSSHGSLRWRAAEIIAELTQNNPYCQERVLEAGLLPVLLSLVDTDDNQQVRIKALYALSCKLFLTPLVLNYVK